MPVRIDVLTAVDLSILKALQRASDGLPISIVIEALISLALFLPGIALYTEKLQDVTYRGEFAKRSIDDAPSLAFAQLSQRGKALYGDSGLGHAAGPK